MRDAGIGRLLVASLHQGIADRLPDRLEFYENWLNPRGLRDGTIGLAPLHAVLSFLRTEGEDYGRVTAAAGEYAAEWALEELPALRRWAATSLPGPIRRRLALRLVQTLVASTYTGSRTSVKMQRRAATLQIRNSIFCGVRDRVPAPLCQFYAAAAGRMLAAVGLPVAVAIVACQATGDGACHVQIDMSPDAREAS
jgi:bacteriochlorophyll 4-vinyl reductase